MRPGPKARPTILKQLRGTWRADRHGKRPEPVAPGALIATPPYLSEAQARRFNEILDNAPRGLLRRWDAPTLAGFVIAEDVIAEANIARQTAEGNCLLDRTEKGQLMIS